MPESKERVTIMLDSVILSKLDALAESQHRSRSNMVEVILIEKLKGAK